MAMSWAFILLLFILPVLLLVIVAVAALFARKSSWSGLFAAIGLLICLPVALLVMTLFTMKSTHRQVTVGHMQVAEIKSAHAQQAEIQERIQELEKQLEEKEISLEQPASDQNSHAKQEKEPHSEIPKWLQSQPIIEQKNLRRYLINPKTIPKSFVISSGRFTTTKEASAEANQIAKQLIEASLTLRFGQSDLILNKDQIRLLTINNYSEAIQIVIIDASPTSMHREHLLVDIGQEYIEPLMPSLRKSLVKIRIIPAAAGLLGIMLTSGLMSLILSRRKEESC